jgi:hypothetical protein
MPNRSLWLVPLLVPIATLAACGSIADPAPFQDSASNGSASAPSGTAAPAAATGNGPAAADATSGAPGTAAEPARPGSASNAPPEGAALLPISAAPSPDVPATAPAPPATPAPAIPANANADPVACASYDTGFLPLVHQPVCSSCHTASGSLPRFEPFASAEPRCALIGREVASSAMPPRGGLSAEQRAVVASWVSLDCPETAAEAAQLCAPSPANPTPGATPPPAASGAGNDDDEDRGGDDEDRGGDDD